MAFRHHQVTLGAAALPLSTGLTDDVPYRQITMHVTGADANIGGPLVTTSDYGTLLDSATQDRLTLGPLDGGGLKLSQIYAVGAGSTIHLSLVPY